jgi:AraC-like DNA-binding protein
MELFAPASSAVSIRAYGASGGTHRHDFAQLVLPLAGSLTVEISGRERRLDRSLGAFVDKGCLHSQESGLSNQSLVLDLDRASLAPYSPDRLAEQPFLQLTPAANHLIDYMAVSIADAAVPASKLRFWTPLLLDTLLGEPPHQRSRLGALLAAIDANPGASWTAATMAARAGVSVSRLHALFREELDTTPRAWLAELRLGRVREWLATTNASIAELAYRSGYADQSALTRAMRKATGLTPAAYRRRELESGTKIREP